MALFFRGNPIEVMAPRLTFVLAALLLAGCSSAPATTLEVLEHTPVAKPARIEPFQVALADGTAAGLLGVPFDPEPTTLLMLSHAFGGRADDYRADLLRYAQEGVLAAAMEYRGNVADYKVSAGVEDTIAGAQELNLRYPSIEKTLVYGWSMGGEIALLAAAQAPPGTFDYVFAGSAITDLEAYWNENLPLRPAVEAETGGPPSDVPAEYDERSPWMQAAALADRRIARIFLVHGAGDSPVPIDHSERLYQALVDQGQPVSFYVMARNASPWVCVPVVSVCTPGPEQGIASHEAGQLHILAPFIDHRIEGARDPAEDAVRGTYDGKSGMYDPSDVG